ncbi:MAG: hypothetical protein DVB28_001769 [Verrucomicrobia bacterium]|nr:MAG: hypothetical protein DVB28_001769 [Verrucomicrobiota bacterium]
MGSRLFVEWVRSRNFRSSWGEEAARVFHAGLQSQGGETQRTTLVAPKY